RYSGLLVLRSTSNVLPRERVLAERLPPHRLYRDVPDAVHRADLVDREDVGMVQGRRRARFLLEAREPIRVLRRRAAENLDRDRAAQGKVAGAVHLTHAARAQLLGDLVVPEPPLTDEVEGRWLAHAPPVEFSRRNQHTTLRP